MKKLFMKKPTTLLSAVLVLALLLSACGQGNVGTAGGAPAQTEVPVVLTPAELYQSVERSELENLLSTLDASLDTSASSQHIDTDAALRLYAPAHELLEQSAGVDLSWLESLSLSAGLDVLENDLGADASLALNGTEILSAELLFDLADSVLYGIVPQISQTAFFYEMTEDSDIGITYNTAMLQLTGLLERLPDSREVEDLLSRCLDAALDALEDVEQGEDSLRAGEVSATYTTLTVTADEDDLLALTQNVCAVLREDAALREMVTALEETLNEMYGDLYSEGELYETLLSKLDALEEAAENLELDAPATMTVYIDEDSAVRGREIVILYGGSEYYILEAAPRDGIAFGYEFRAEKDGTAYVAVAGDGKISRDIMDGSFVVLTDTEDGAIELLTVEVEDFDCGALADGIVSGVFTLRPTRAFYTDVLETGSLYASILEDFSFVLDLDGGRDRADAVLSVYMADELFADLTVSCAVSAAEQRQAPLDAVDLESWAMGLDFGDMRILENLQQAGVPASVLSQLVYNLMF